MTAIKYDGPITQVNNLEIRVDEPENIGTFYVRVYKSTSQNKLIISIFRESNVGLKNLPDDTKQITDEIKVN
jgi:hypothetical protein